MAIPFVVPGGPTSPAAATAARGRRQTPDGFVTAVTLSRASRRAGRTTALDDRVDAALSGEAAAGRRARRVGGSSDLVDAINHQVELDLRTGEGIALPVSFLVMVVVFGGFLAAGMPIVGAVASIAGALASLLGFSHLIDLDATVVNVVTVLGLGLCIDYGLLSVSRFREELRAARRPPVAGPAREVAARPRPDHRLRRTHRGLLRRHRGISLAGLMVFKAPLMRAIGAAGALGRPSIAVLVALTLVPALSSLGGAG